MKIRYFWILLILFTVSCKQEQKIDLQQNSDFVQNDTQKNKQLENEKPEIIKPQKQKAKIPKKIKYKKFTKGIYLTAYTINSPKFYAILDSAEAAGINTLVFDLKNMNGHVFFRIPQKGFLRNENIKPIIDIGGVVKEAHRRDMRAVARIVMFHDQLTAKRDSLLRPQNQEGGYWLESKRKGASWLDSSNAKVQNTVLFIIEEAAKSGLDEIQLDYVRFPTQGKISDAIFAYQIEDSLLARNDTTYVFRNKSDVIKDFVSNAKELCNKYDVTLTADVFAIVAWQRKADINATGQDIGKMTVNLDAIHPMIYSSHFNKNFGYREDLPNEPYFIVYKGSKLTKRYSENYCRTIPYIQSNSWKVNYGYNYMISQIQAVIDSDADGYILWNASNRYFKTLNWIKKFENIE